MAERNRHVERVRAYLDAQEGPKWLSEITAAMREINPAFRPSVVSAMVSRGFLVRHVAPGQPANYTVGARPAKPLTDAQKKDRQRTYEEKRSVRRTKERRAAGIPARAHARASVRRDFAGKPTAARDGETVDQFLARGGKVEQLGGLKKSNVHARRRPVMMGRGSQI